MTKQEMIVRMDAVAFRVQGIELQLSAGQMLRAAAATTVEERGKCVDVCLVTSRVVAALHLAVRFFKTARVEKIDKDRLPKPFNELENMTEEEIADWIVKECTRRERRKQEARDD